jgi:tRNA pseudouridine55 synthase
MNKKRNVNGILLLDKPQGLSSNQALSLAKRLFSCKKAGHTGSLDPLATGLLPICFGEATKFSQFLLDAHKYYQVTIQLGIRTDSGDSEGKVISAVDFKPFSLSRIEETVAHFTGNLLQVPPMYSAIKHQGQPLYKLARLGVEIERKARGITIYASKIVHYEDDKLELKVHTSKGTYIRTLADDIGQKLGCGAHVTALRRIGVGPFSSEHLRSVEALEATQQEGGFAALDKLLLPVDRSITDWPALKLSEAAAYYLKQGQPVLVPYAPTEGWVKLFLQDEQFLGVGEILEDGRVAPRRLISLCEI